MTNWIFRTIVVEASIAEQVRGLISQIVEGQGEEMFRTPLSETGQEPATHYISSGMIEEKYGEYLPYGEFFNIEKLTEFAPIEVINMLIEKMQVCELEPLVLIENIGLKLVQDDTEG